MTVQNSAMRPLLRRMTRVEIPARLPREAHHGYRAQNPLRPPGWAGRQPTGIALGLRQCRRDGNPCRRFRVRHARQREHVGDGGESRRRVQCCRGCCVEESGWRAGRPLSRNTAGIVRHASGRMLRSSRQRVQISLAGCGRCGQSDRRGPARHSSGRGNPHGLHGHRNPRCCPGRWRGGQRRRTEAAGQKGEELVRKPSNHGWIRQRSHRGGAFPRFRASLSVRKLRTGRVSCHEITCIRGICRHRRCPKLRGRPP
jgi:hypothetical protein